MKEYKCPDCGTTKGIIVLNIARGRCTNCGFNFTLKNHEFRKNLLIKA